MAGSTRLILQQITSADPQQKKINEQGFDSPQKASDENTPALTPTNPDLLMANLLKNCLQPHKSPNPDSPK